LVLILLFGREQTVREFFKLVAQIRWGDPTTYFSKDGDGLTRLAPKLEKSESLLLRPHEYRREVQKATNDRSQIEKSIEESGESAPPPLVCAPLRGQVRSTRQAIARRVAVPNAKPDAKKKTRARSFLGRCAGTGKPAASASRAR